METLLNNNFIKVNRGSMSISYVIEDDSLFYNTGYKVLQGQEKNGFVKCTRTLHNGKTKLSYDVSNYQTLQSMGSILTPDSFMQIIGKLLNSLIEVSSNGFMKCENIDIDFESIFVDENNLNVYLVYIPLTVSLYQNSNMEFETVLKKNILAFLMQNRNLISPATRGLKNDLENEQTTLTKIYDNIKNRNTAPGGLSGALSGGLSGGLNQQGAKGIYGRDSAAEAVVPDPMPMQSPYHDVHPPRSSSSGSSSKSLYIVLSLLVFAAIEAGIYFTTFAKMRNIFFIGSGVALILVICALVVILTTGNNSNRASRRERRGQKNKSEAYVGQVHNIPRPSQQSASGVTEVLEEAFVPGIAIAGVNTPEKVSIVIDKPEFVLGKNPESVDGAILFNKAISRIHCKITVVNGEYFISDMGSANGTFVNNGPKLESGQKAQIRVGDKIRLANSEFIVKKY